MTVKYLFRKAMDLPVDSDGYLSEGDFTIHVMKRGEMIDIYRTLSLRWTLVNMENYVVACEIIDGKPDKQNAVEVDASAPSGELPAEVREALLTVGVVGRRHL